MSAVAAPPQKPRARQGLPTRELSLESGRVTRSGLARHLAVVPLPDRTVALLAARTDGLAPVDELVVRWSSARLRSLVQRLLTEDRRVASYREDVAALTGLGPGLTPTGDDLLVGLSAMARRLAAAGLVDPRAAAAFATSLLAADTTAEAQTLLEEASRGRFPAVLAAVVELLGDPAADLVTLKDRAARLTATGAHSGADLLAGAMALCRGALEWEQLT